MNTILTLLCKDLKRFLPHCLALLALMLVFYAQHPELQKPQFNFEWLLFILSALTLVAAWVVFITIIVHDDTPSGTSEFWMTRPISGAQLFVAKFITIVVFFVVMPSLTLFLIRTASGLFSPHTATPASLVSSLTFLLVIALGTMLVPALTRTSAEFVVCMIGLAVVYMILVFMTMHAPKTPEIIVQNPKLFFWTRWMVSVAGMAAIIYTQYVRRRRNVTIVATMLLVLLLIGSRQLWPTVPKTNLPSDSNIEKTQQNTTQTPTKPAP